MQLLPRLVFLITLLSLLQACSIYQSGGREAIEKDSGNIVTKSGFTEAFTHYFECEGTHKRPGFLDKANQVLVTPFETADYTVLTSQTDPLKWITVFRYMEDNKAYFFCKIQSA